MAKVELGNASRKFAFTLECTDDRVQMMEMSERKEQLIAYMPAAYVEASKTWNTLTVRS